MAVFSQSKNCFPKLRTLPTVEHSTHPIEQGSKIFLHSANLLRYTGHCVFKVNPKSFLFAHPLEILIFSGTVKSRELGTNTMCCFNSSIKDIIMSLILVFLSKNKNSLLCLKYLFQSFSKKDMYSNLDNF